MLSNLCQAYRQLAKSPGFTLLAIVTLGLGVGANTAMFSAINSLMLRPLPYQDSRQLDAIYRGTQQDPDGPVSPADFLDLEKSGTDFGEICAFAYGNLSFAEPGQPAEMPRSILVSTNFFSMLRVKPQLGRDFRPEEGVPGNDHVVLISQNYWKERFGGRPDILGLTVRVDGTPSQIIGVLPQSFNDWRHLGWANIIVPLSFDKAATLNRHNAYLRVIGRRSPLLSEAQASAFIAGIGKRLAAEHPAEDGGTTWRTKSLNATMVSGNGPEILTMLVGLSGFVLLIACSNLANLLLARAIGRAHEFAVRAALGASRLRLLLPLIAEALILSAVSAIFAVVFALWTMGWLSTRFAQSLGATGGTPANVLVLDWRVLLWTIAASAFTAIAFSLAPAVFALHLNVNSTLKSGARGATGDRGHRRFRQLLIIGQFALAMVLLAGAALFGRGLSDLSRQRSGWESEHLVSGTIILPSAHYPDAGKIDAFHRTAIERIEAIPGVSSASVASFTPFFDWYDSRKYMIQGQSRPEPNHEPSANVNNVSPGYFKSVGTRLLAGRVFDEHDNESSTPVCVIGQSTAAAFFGIEDPIGHRLAEAGSEESRWMEIVGVVADVRSIYPDHTIVAHQLYQPMAQEPRARCEILIRMTGTAASAPIEAIRNTIMTLDPDLPIRRLQPADASVEFANSTWNTLGALLLALALLGLGLAALGIYGVMTRTMAQRTGEFAIRLALGAKVADIARLVLGGGLKLAVLGSVFGILGAFGLSQLLLTAFPSIHVSSPAVVLFATLTLFSIAMLASWLPARRATRVDPMIALRSE